MIRNQPDLRPDRELTIIAMARADINRRSRD
jgi:hypothetical protein